MKKNILGRVIKILNDKTIVVNVGNAELKVGDRINILDECIEIKDPDTKALLGSYSFKKAILVIRETYELFSIAEAYEFETISNSLALAMNPLLKSNKQIIPLNVNKEDNENITLENKEIKIGDEICKTTEN